MGLIGPMGLMGFGGLHQPLHHRPPVACQSFGGFGMSGTGGAEAGPAARNTSCSSSSRGQAARTRCGGVCAGASRPGVSACKSPSCSGPRSGPARRGEAHRPRHRHRLCDLGAFAGEARLFCDALPRPSGAVLIAGRLSTGGSLVRSRPWPLACASLGRRARALRRLWVALCCIVGAAWRCPGLWLGRPFGALAWAMLDPGRCPGLRLRRPCGALVTEHARCGMCSLLDMLKRGTA